MGYGDCPGCRPPRAEEARTRLRIPPKGIRAFEELLDGCEKWIAGCEAPSQAVTARSMAEKRFCVEVRDFETFAMRLAECHRWIRDSNIGVAEEAVEQRKDVERNVNAIPDDEFLKPEPGPPVVDDSRRATGASGPPESQPPFADTDEGDEEDSIEF